MSSDRSSSLDRRPTRPAPVSPGEEVLPLPHERDQGSTPVTGPELLDRATMKQAHQDLERGLVDTDLRATLGLDAERRRQLVPGSR